jgi:thermostable 8-oxoguanine DNA glycosylase
LIAHGTSSILALYPGITGDQAMLVERDLKVMNVEAIGEAYAIASHYLRKSGVIPDTHLTNDRLLEIIVRMFHRGEGNNLRLANTAIVQFQAAQPQLVQRQAVSAIF